MPRSTPKTRQNAVGNVFGLHTSGLAPTSNVVSKTASVAPKRGRAVKKEPGSGTETVTEQVFHRKSERRRVARDIFLVFEEQPSTRRSRGTNKKQVKPKFGHLKVEEPVKPKGLLRDIKNEPKCYLNSNGNSDKPLTKKNSKSESKSANQCFDVWSSTSCPPCKSICSKLKIKEPEKVSQDVIIRSNIEEAPVVARVNPIFLWAKQDNSRIIEVRCEDYDKRNRIRITKTSNGWRAIPRSDPTSSKVLKLYSSPLLKVKRETLNVVANHISQTPAASFSIENKLILNSSDINALRIVEDTTQTDITFGRSGRKSKKKKSKKRKKSFECRNIVSCNNAPVPDNVNVSGSPKKSAADFVKDCTSKESFDKDICIVGSESSIVKEDRSSQDFPLNPEIISNIEHVTDVSLRNSSPFGEITEGALNDKYSFQLCPKTGLFLRSSFENVADDLLIMDCNSENSLELNRHKKLLTESKHITLEENHESLEAKTRNLKDLLDDADLFQHCDDNANGDSDLIDTLVKTSCENNLLHDNEAIIKESLGHRQIKDIGHVPKEDENLVQLITEVSEPPKCLSFNEAGEIEALNCDLFQSNAYMDAFEKQTTTISETRLPIHTMSELEPPHQDNLTVTLDLGNSEKSVYDINNSTDESPKDLSYKKREEVCPPSESRSQCAVTSSSDVIKSPSLDESSVLASSSETLKNLILEQFIKLNTLSDHKKNHIDANKQAKSVTQLNSMYVKSIGSPLNDIETVVIDDDDSAVEVSPNEDDAAPLKKRLRSSAVLTQHKSEVDITIKEKMALIDKDPDPLTQLRLLIQNSQWKVPDPILVPKDRLSAVLASPAREIPLLITTRPELRLPEAFAYPEIIQNPNILVISMAQLEAILKNDLEVNKSKPNDKVEAQTAPLNVKQRPVRSHKTGSDFQGQSHQSKQMPNIADLYQRESNSTSSMTVGNTQKEDSTKFSHNSTVIPSELNAATMAVLNQMLWLPYFGQMSQDFIKSIKPSSSATEKMATMMPFGPQHVETICEQNTQASLSSMQHATPENSAGPYGNPSISSSLKQSQIDEMALFQKVLQQQMQNVVNINLAKNNAMERQTATSNQSTIERNAHSDSGGSSNAAQNNSTNNKNTFLLKNNKVVDQSSCNILDLAGKTYNLRSSIASRQSSDANQYSNVKRTNSDKPRVTCKSLSNLLDPEHNQTPNASLTSNTMPMVSNVGNSFLHDINGMKSHHPDSKNVCKVRETIKDNKALKSLVRSCNSSNVDVASEYTKQNNKLSEHSSSESGARNQEPSMLPTETNVPLWHPLFGSNTKSAYSSQWQWTTVTAAGE